MDNNDVTRFILESLTGKMKVGSLNLDRCKEYAKRDYPGIKNLYTKFRNNTVPRKKLVP